MLDRIRCWKVIANMKSINCDILVLNIGLIIKFFLLKINSLLGYVVLFVKAVVSSDSSNISF